MFCQAVCFNFEQNDKLIKIIEDQDLKDMKTLLAMKNVDRKLHNFIEQIIWLYNLQYPSFVKCGHCATIVSKPMTTKRQINQNY